jgi:hypothetical protein
MGSLGCAGKERASIADGSTSPCSIPRMITKGCIIGSRNRNPKARSCPRLTRISARSSVMSFFRCCWKASIFTGLSKVFDSGLHTAKGAKVPRPSGSVSARAQAKRTSLYRLSERFEWIALEYSSFMLSCERSRTRFITASTSLSVIRTSAIKLFVQQAPTRSVRLDQRYLDTFKQIRKLDPFQVTRVANTPR